MPQLAHTKQSWWRGFPEVVSTCWPPVNGSLHVQHRSHSLWKVQFTSTLPELPPFGDRWFTHSTASLPLRKLARAMQLKQWRSPRRDRVSRPCRSMNDPKGDWQAPRSRSCSTRALKAKATFAPPTGGNLPGPKTSQNTRPW